MEKVAAVPRNIKNVLTSATNPHAALSKLRLTLPTRLYGPVLAFLPSAVRRSATNVRVHNRQGFQRKRNIEQISALGPSFPTSYAMLLRGSSILEPLEITQELLWTTQRLVSHASQINHYLDLKHSFENSFQKGDLATSELILDTIEADLGVSFFLIESRLAFLQLSKGLEAQKRYLNRIRSACTRGLLPFIVAQLSHKNEFATNPASYPERFLSILNRSNLEPGLFNFLVHRVLRTPLPPDLSAELLCFEQNTPLIDQYETVLSILEIHRDAPQTILPSLNIARASILDERLDRIGVLAGVETQKGLHLDVIQLESERFLASYRPAEALAAIQSLPSMSVNPQLAILEALCRADLLAPCSEQCSPGSSTYISNLLFRVILKDEIYEDALYDLLRLISGFPTFAVSKILKPALWNAATDIQSPYQGDIVSAFVSSPFLSSEYLAILPINVSQSLTAQIKGFSVIRSTGEGFSIDEVSKPSPLPKRLRIEALRAESHRLLDSDELESAMELMADSYIAEPLIVRMIPIDRCAKAINEDDTSTLGRELPLSIVYDLYLRYFGEDRPYIRNDAYEDFLMANGCAHPSQLTLPLPKVKHTHLIYYLRYVCVPEVMLNSAYYTSSKSLEDERLLILTLLKTVDLDNASVYDTEIRDITREQIVQQGLRHVEQSKLAMDTQPLRRWAEKNLKESYSRMRDLVSAGMEPLHPVPDKTREQESDLLLAPVDEVVDTARETLLRFLDEAYTNSFHGLDSYLSMRARHGSFAGQLRAVFEDEDIITLRDAHTDEYKSNETWLRRLPSNLHARAKLDVALQDFAKRFDQVVQKFSNDKLQIYSREKPEGLFSHTVEGIDILLLVQEVQPTSSFDRFIDLAFVVFWQNVEASTLNVRTAIDHELRLKISELERLKKEAPQLDELLSAVRRAQTSMQSSLEILKEWFHTPKLLPTLVYTMDEVIDISLQQVKRLHPDFDPKVTRDVWYGLSILQLPKFSDIFFLIFDNIQAHSGVGNSPAVSIEVSFLNGVLRISVSNEMEAWAGIEDKLTRTRDIIKAGQYHRVIKSEGGTGLVKLWNTIRNEHSTLDFTPHEGVFIVTLSFPLDVVEPGGSV
jgi:hypothetical protein